MSEQFQGIQYRRDVDDPCRFFYIPGSPSPELMPGGTPSASLIKAGDGGFLQLGVHWDVSQDQLHDLEKHLTNEFPDLNSTPRLSLETLTVNSVKLVLQMPDRSSNVLANSSSAGYPPFTALFNAMLDGARFAQASMAYSGRQNVLTVRYEISAQTKVSCTATLVGDVSADVEELDPSGDLDACRSQIESAITAGRLRLTVTGDSVSADLRDKAVREAKERAAGILHRMLSNTDASVDVAHLQASATMGAAQPLTLTREADVGQWFSGMKSANLMVTAGRSPS